MSSNWVLGVFKQVFMTFEHLNEIYDKCFMTKEQTAILHILYIRYYSKILLSIEKRTQIRTNWDKCLNLSSLEVQHLKIRKTYNHILDIFGESISHSKFTKHKN
jgi:hypothetical protein